MRALYRLACGHEVLVTLATLEHHRRRPLTPAIWWCRTCQVDQPVTGRLR